MKHLKLGAMLLALTFVFASCSKNEEMEKQEEKEQALLKSYKVVRDANGAYSLEYKVVDNTISEVSKDLNTKVNEVYLSKVDYNTKNSYRNDFNLEANKLKIGFVDVVTNKKSRITIEDENIKFAKGVENSEYLSSYSVEQNEDGTYQLDFSVKNNVAVDFDYNEQEGIYEINLKRGVNNQSNFSKTFKKEEGTDLKIDFVNFTTASRGLSEGDGEKDKDKDGWTKPRRPRVIVSYGD